MPIAVLLRRRDFPSGPGEGGGYVRGGGEGGGGYERRPIPPPPKLKPAFKKVDAKAPVEVTGESAREAFKRAPPPTFEVKVLTGPPPPREDVVLKIDLKKMFPYQQGLEEAFLLMLLMDEE